MWMRIRFGQGWVPGLGVSARQASLGPIRGNHVGHDFAVEDSTGQVGPSCRVRPRRGQTDRELRPTGRLSADQMLGGHARLLDQDPHVASDQQVWWS